MTHDNSFVQHTCKQHVDMACGRSDLLPQWAARRVWAARRHGRSGSRRQKWLQIPAVPAAALSAVGVALVQGAAAEAVEALQVLTSSSAAGGCGRRQQRQEQQCRRQRSQQQQQPHRHQDRRAGAETGAGAVVAVEAAKA